MRWFPLVLFLGASFKIAAQNAPAPVPAADTGQKVRLEGTILSLNGDVVRKATVRLQVAAGQPSQPPVSYSETSDNGGRFVFDDIAPGRYTLSAEKPGFMTARYGARSNTSPGTQLNLSAGADMKDLAIKMTPQGVIAGKVVDQDGDPVVSVQVQAMRSTYAGGRKQLQLAGGATTNDLGEYRLISLMPGRYYISASDRRQLQNFAQERPGRAGTVQEGSITTYYANAADVSGAVGVDVVAGSEMRGTDIRMLRAKVYTVRGKAVVESGGTPAAVITFTRKDASDPLTFLAGSTNQLRPDGSFEFRNIIPGTYVLQLMQTMVVSGNQSANVTGRVEVTVADANIEGLVLPLMPRPEIQGTVTLEDGDISPMLKPAQRSPGQPLAASPGFPQPGRLVINLISTGNGPTSASNAQINEDGIFRFTGLGTSQYALNVISLPPGTYLKSARFVGQDVLHAPIDLTSGTGGTLELVLSSKAGSVTGSVQNEKGEVLTGTMVTLWPKTPDSSPSGGVRFGFTDENGAWKFQGLGPGDYRVAAWEDLDRGLAEGADFLSRFASDAVAITLSEGGQESKDLKPIPADKIAIEVANIL